MSYTGNRPRSSMRTMLRSIILTVVALGAAFASADAVAGEFQIEPGSFKMTTHDQGGHAEMQAGAHPFAVTTQFNLVTVPDPRSTDGTRMPAGANMRTTDVATPPGLVGNPYAVPQCTTAEFLHVTNFFHICSDNAQVGIAEVRVDFGSYSEEVRPMPIYNLVPGAGQPAAFGFWVVNVPVILVPHLRSNGDYGLTVEGRNLDESMPVNGVSITLWGVPASSAHDSERNDGYGVCSSEISPPCVSTVKPKAFLTSSVDCAAGPLTSTLFAESWKGESDTTSTPFTDELGNPVGMTGCNRVPFDPSVAIEPSIGSAETPSGLKFELDVPEQGILNPTGLSQAEVKKSVVRLPEGMTINPSAGEGLGACTPADYAREQLDTPPGEGCPNQSKLGTVRIDTPLLNEPLTGSLFLAQPDDVLTTTPGAENPFDSLVAIYVVVRLPERGIIVKSAGKVVPDPKTGQLVTTFEDLPQLPFSKFTISFREGQRAPLATPPTCGTFASSAELTPWSASNGNPAPSEVANVESTFDITGGSAGNGACPAGGAPPFSPSVLSGTANNAAGIDSPFYLRISRSDGEQEITKFSTTLPEGLTGNLSGIPFCSDTAIEASRSKTGGQEIANPSCPAASEIGHTLVGAGVGGVLAWTPGKIYLAGPYHGSTMSIVSITSAKVGPFDLGTVVIRFALKINPLTAQVEIDGSTSDPIPHIIKGIVVHVREIHVYVDRAKFIRNPTSCEPKAITNEITGAGVDFSNLTGQVPVATTRRFQAADCASLAFQPTFRVTTSGKTSRKNGASLKVKLSFPTQPRQANIRYVKVALPSQLPSRLVTLQKACRVEVFEIDPAHCPVESRVGTAKAITPILPDPLVGPAYFVSHGGAKFPELVAVLQGYGIRIDLHGDTFIRNGVTTSTFSAVPDEPVASFELNLPQGKFSALAANGNLCKEKLAMPTEFIAQNGVVIKRSTKVTATGCPAVRHRKSKKAKRSKKHG